MRTDPLASFSKDLQKSIHKRNYDNKYNRLFGLDNKYNRTRIFGLKETDELKNTVYDGDLWRKYRDRQNAMARARYKARKNEME
jgi:hypothetical protein